MDKLYPGWNQANHFEGLPSGYWRSVFLRQGLDCPYCHGTGTVQYLRLDWRIVRDICPECKGTGKA